VLLTSLTEHNVDANLMMSLSSDYQGVVHVMVNVALSEKARLAGVFL